MAHPIKLNFFYIELSHAKCYEKLDNLTMQELNELLKREIIAIVIKLILLSNENYQSFNNSNSWYRIEVGLSE